MDEIKDLLQYQLGGIIDYKGQATADKFLNIVIYSGAILSVLIGFITQNFEYFAIGLGATYVASLIFCLPIPAYRRNPVKFLDPSISVKKHTQLPGSSTSKEKVEIVL